MNDEKLDLYISNMKDTKLSDDDILSNYKKAIKRIEVLKTKYNEINKPKKKSKNKTNDDVPISELVDRLNKIKEELDSVNEIDEMVDLYTEYNDLIKKLETQYDELKNEYKKVSTNSSGNIVLKKIELENI